MTDETTLVTENEDVTEPSGETLVTTEDTSTEASEETVKDPDQKDEAEQGAPEEYEEFNFPETILPDEELVGEFKTFAKENGFTQEKAQELVNLHNKAALKEQERWTKQVKEWEQESRNDPEFGRSNFNENIGVAKEALKFFGNDELVRIVDHTGIGNHPEFIRFLHKIGARMKEAGFHQSGGNVEKPRDPAHILYPDMN